LLIGCSLLQFLSAFCDITQGCILYETSHRIVRWLPERMQLAFMVVAVTRLQKKRAPVEHVGPIHSEHDIFKHYLLSRTCEQDTSVFTTGRVHQSGSAKLTDNLGQ